MKACFKCEAVKPLSEFYKHPKMSDGHLGKCKECSKRDTSNWSSVKSQDPQWRISEMERHRNKQRRYRETGKDNVLVGIKKKETNDRYFNKYPEKKIAKLRSQHLKPRPCEVCGEVKVDRHHEDYSKPKEVRWLCRKHHAERHVEIRKESILKNAAATR